MSSSIPSTMRAWVYRVAGQPKDVLTLESAWPVPVPKAGELLIKVHSAGLNPIGYKSMSVFPLTMAAKKPAIPELDFAGTVVVGAEGFEVGERVCGTVLRQRDEGKGSLAEYIAVRPDILARLPANVALEGAAGLAATGVTSYAAMVHAAKVTKGTRVFVNGGTSGTGSMAIQIAKAQGAYVVATGNVASVELLRSIGADEVIDYRAVGDLPKHLATAYGNGKEFDVIYDTVGVGALYHSSPAYLKPSGLFVDIALDVTGLLSLFAIAGAQLNRNLRPTWLGGTPRQYKFFITPADQECSSLVSLVTLVGQGKVRQVVDSEWRFEDVVKAYDVVKSGRARGKVIVRVAE